MLSLSYPQMMMATALWLILIERWGTKPIMWEFNHFLMHFSSQKCNFNDAKLNLERSSFPLPKNLLVRVIRYSKNHASKNACKRLSLAHSESKLLGYSLAIVIPIIQFNSSRTGLFAVFQPQWTRRWFQSTEVTPFYMAAFERIQF